jgi:hypothetical protein
MPEAQTGNNTRTSSQRAVRRTRLGVSYGGPDTHAKQRTTPGHGQPAPTCYWLLRRLVHILAQSPMITMRVIQHTSLRMVALDGSEVFTSRRGRVVGYSLG